MDWNLTSAQKCARAYAEEMELQGRVKDSNDDLLEMLVCAWRENKRPPLGTDVPKKRSTMARRLGGFPAARALARERLTEREREEYQWRCHYCQEVMEGPKGIASHESGCRRKARDND